MKKKYLLFPILMMLLASCRPVLDPSSEQGSSDTSGEPSESTTDTDSGGDSGDDSSGDDSSSDIPPAPTDKTIEELCDEMNAKLALKTDLFDPFIARDYLIENGFTYLPGKQENNEYFGYDYSKNKVVIYSVTNSIRNVRYPNDCKNDECSTFQSQTVNTLESLNLALRDVGLGINNYSTIKFGNDIILTSGIGIVINHEYPVEIDFDNYTIRTDNNVDLVRVSDSKSVVSLKNGTISTMTCEEYDLDISPAAIRVADAKTIHIDNVKFKCNAHCGYGYYNESGKPNIKTLIENCDGIFATTVAICIQDGINTIKNCKINGIVDINGGNTVIDGCNISAAEHGRHDDATALITNTFVVSRAEYYFDNNRDSYDDYILSSVDPIIIFDRRSFKHTYSITNVTVRNSTLTPDFTSDLVYGYGIRYIDLKYDDQKANPGTIVIENNNVFPKCTDSNPEETTGGYTKYTNPI